MNPVFTFEYIENQFNAVSDRGYKVMSCADYTEYKKKPFAEKIFVNRVDVDFSVKKAEVLATIFDKLKIKTSFFVRLHAAEYNPFSFENYTILRKIRDSGHEIGYHSEIVDQAAAWNEDAAECLRRDIAVMEKMLGIKIRGAASHGGTTGLNNLDFWKDKKPSDFGLLYEAYDKEPAFNLFHESLYVSDSNWTSWKCYQNGILMSGDSKSLLEHAANDHPVIYSLIHPDTFS